MLLTEAIEALCIATRADGRSPATVAAYREKLGHLLAYLGDVDAATVTIDDLRRYVVWSLDRRKLSPFTVSTRVRAVKRLFNWLAEEGQIKGNPAEKLKTPTPKRKEPKGVALDDVKAMLDTCGDGPAGRRDRAALLFLLDTGCRAGGLCGLQVGDLDLDGLTAMVYEKGGKSRFVMFTEPTAGALRAWLAVRPRCEAGSVFVSLKRCEPLTPSGLWQLVNRRAKRAGIGGPVSVHGFRHTFARLYLLDGGDLASLSDLLGHSDMRVTKDYYGVFALSELREKHRRHTPVAKIFGDGYNDN